MCSAGNQAQAIYSTGLSSERAPRILMAVIRVFVWSAAGLFRCSKGSRRNLAARADRYWLMYQYPTLLFTELAYHMRPCESMKNSRMEISECGYGYSITSPVLGSKRPIVSCSCEAYQIILLRSMPMA